jgi:diguanylate cyclase (GGDEF)-like protein/PAS domain S-box-containing protein
MTSPLLPGSSSAPGSAVLDIGFLALLHASPDAVLVVDSAGNILALNHQVERLLGHSSDALKSQKLDWIIPTRFHRVLDTQPLFSDQFHEPRTKGAPVSLFARRVDGSECPVEINRSPLGPEHDSLILVTMRDLTEWRRAQDSLFQEKERAVITLESIGDAVIATDLAGTITYLNPVAERLTGWRTTEALGMASGTILTFISDTTREPIEGTVERCLKENRTVDLQDGVLLLRRDGTEVAIGDSAAPIRDRNGVTTGVVLVFHDVTENRRVSNRLSHEAAHDALTGLVNRKEFERRLVRALADAASGDGAEHALCYLDLDRFKAVNDTCGHEAGDEVLRLIAALLRGHMRKRDTLARLGGDEFGVLLENCPLSEAREVAEVILTAMKGFEYKSGDQTFSVGISIGLVPITALSGRVAALLRKADAACYSAKDSGGSRVCVEEPKVGAGVPSLIQSRPDNRVARALKDGQFHLYAQRIVALLAEGSARPRCEILLRLHDERGSLQPAATFLPLADRYNLMPAIDRWVIRQTSQVVGNWHRSHPGHELPLCCINISAASLDDENIIRTVREQLAEHQLPPKALCFEIAEAAALGNFAQTVRFISEMRATGCGVALDDFGGGVHSFAHLKALPVDFLKIGGHYVRGVVNDPVYGTMVAAVNQIGRLLGIATIAEEVDSEPVMERLRNLGIDYAQGHAVALPEPFTNSNGEVAHACFQQQLM